MATISDLVPEVAAINSVSASAVAAFAAIIARLQPSADDPRIQELIDELETDKVNLANAIASIPGPTPAGNPPPAPTPPTPDNPPPPPTE